MNDELVNRLEIWGFEEGIALFRDKSLGFGFSLMPHDISCASDDSINQIKAQLKTFLASLPSQIDVQFVQSIDRGDTTEIEDHFGESAMQQSIVSTLAEDRVERFKSLQADGDLTKRELLLFVRIPFKAELTLKSRVIRIMRPTEEQESIERLNQALAKTRVIQDEIERNLTSVGLKPQLLEPIEITRMIFNIWNPDRTDGLSGYFETDIRSRVIVSDLVKEVRGFRLGKFHHRVVSLKTLPEETVAGMAEALTNLPFSSRTYLSLHVPDQQREISWLKINRNLAYAMLVGKKGTSDLESEAKFKDIEDLLGHLIRDGERIFHVALTVVLRSENESELDLQVSNVLRTMRELAGSEGFVESYGAFDIFAESSLPNARSKNRMKRLRSSNVVDLLPVFGQWHGFQRPSVLMRTRTGELFKFDPFSSTLTNANQVISGGSGSGKSYLANLMINQMLLQKPRVFILDIGASYQKTCELLDGQYIPLSLSSDISLNPFDLPPGETRPTSEKIKFLTALIEIMVEEDGSRQKKLERSEIEEAIRALYVTTKSPRLSDLRELLLKHENDNIVRIGKTLQMWTGDSPYGKILDRPTSIELAKRIVCFDLKGLESASDLQAACLFTITDLVWREVQRDRTEMKFLIFDESWKLLESEAGSQFIAEVFRTFRKYYASAIAISQNIDDFASSRAASAIMPNSSIKWLLKQPGADFRRLAEVLRLNEREIELIQNLDQVKGQYSETFLICEDKRAVVSVESTPMEYWLATTDPKDFSLLKQEQTKTHKSGLELISHLAEHFPTGANRS